MAQPAPQPDDRAAIQTRIKTHMNTSHRDSLSLFLQHYCNLPPSSASPNSTTLETLTLDSLILSSNNKRYHIPLHPPLSSFSFPGEIRQRMKEMHEQCLHALDLSSVKITHYRPPETAIQKLTFLVVAMTLLAFCRRSNFIPGSLFYQTFRLGYVPNFASFCRTIQPWLLPGILAIHVGEVVWMARTRLRRHGVRRWSGLWWMWVGTCFIEGWGSFQRIDGMVGEMETETEAKVGNKGEKEK